MLIFVYRSDKIILNNNIKYVLAFIMDSFYQA